MYEAIYHSSRERVTSLVSQLSDDALSHQVPACPEWTVRHLVAHLAGGAADVASGRMDGAPSPAWTARHIAERLSRPVPDLLAEWNALTFDEVSSFQAMDIVSHEADLRGALGVQRVPHDVWWPLLERMARRRLPGVEVITPNGVIGEGDASLRVDGYDLFRAFFGRRSRTQMRAWDWSVSGLVDDVPVFPPRDTDLVE